MLSPSVYKGFYTILLCLHPSELQLWDTFANLFLTSAEDFKHQSALAEGLIELDAAATVYQQRRVFKSNHLKWFIPDMSNSRPAGTLVQTQHSRK